MAIRFILIAGKRELTRSYRNAVQSAGFVPVLTESTDLLTDLGQEEAAGNRSVLSRMDLLLLPGGGDISPALFGLSNEGSVDIDEALDLVQLAYLDYFLERKKPVLGICKGMQLIGMRLGASLLQDMPVSYRNIHAHTQYGDSHHSCTYAEPAHIPDFPSCILLHALYRCGSLPDFINSAHHQCLQTLPDTLFAFQHSFDHIIEGFVHTELPVMGLQWHPERLFCRDGSYLKSFLKLLL